MLFPPLVVGLLKLLPCFTTSSSHHQQWVMQEIWWNGILVSGIEEQAGWIYKPGGFLISFSLLWKSVQCFCGVFLILPRTLIVLSFFAVKMKSKIKNLMWVLSLCAKPTEETAWWADTPSTAAPQGTPTSCSAAASPTRARPHTHHGLLTQVLYLTPTLMSTKG